MRELKNGRVSLALHALQEAEGMPLLCLHELGGSAEDFRRELPEWPGPIYALDFSGHGYSGRVYGGGYYPEMWAADADAALAVIGAAVVFGKGVGAYVALLLAGGRAELVRCAVLAGGDGLIGGGEAPDPSRFVLPDTGAAPRSQRLQASPSTDSSALVAQAFYLRPPAYAARFAQRARGVVLVEEGHELPPWWSATQGALGRDAYDSSKAGMRGALAAVRGDT